VKSFEVIAKEIRTNAKHVLEKKNIETSLENYGELFFTGSYALDLMTWNDIDMQLVLKDDVDPINVLGEFYRQITKDPGFIEAQMISFKGKYKPKMPRGVYLGIKLDFPEHGGVWKLDLWVLAKADFEKNRSLIEELKSKLDSETRKFVLELKHEMMTGSDRVPQMGSHLLYKAVLLNGIKRRDELFEFFAKHGIDVKR